MVKPPRLLFHSNRWSSTQWLTPESSLNTRRRTNRNFLDTEFSCWEGGRDGSKTTSGDKETEQRYKRLNSWRTKRQDATPCRSVWPSTMIPSVDTVHRQWTCWYTAFWDGVTVKMEQVGNNKFVAAQDIVPSWTVDAFYFMSLDAPASFRRNPTMYEIEEIPVCKKSGASSEETCWIDQIKNCFRSLCPSDRGAEENLFLVAGGGRINHVDLNKIHEVFSWFHATATSSARK